jgi:arsenate reductase
VINVLVLCTGNSARSILGEVLFNSLSEGRVQAFSAGSQPAGKVNPGAIAKLTREGFSTDGLRSKSWDEFAAESELAVDIVITVCDSAAGESCPVWFGSPITVHWGIPDPAITGSDAEVAAAFDAAFLALERRIKATLELPLEALPGDKLREALDAIHEAAG